MYLASVTGLNDKSHPGTRLLANQMVVDSTSEQKRWDRCHFGIGTPI